jgi:hypothetical protein
MASLKHFHLDIHFLFGIVIGQWLLHKESCSNDSSVLESILITPNLFCSHKIQAMFKGLIG